MLSNPDAGTGVFPTVMRRAKSCLEQLAGFDTWYPQIFHPSFNEERLMSSTASSVLIFSNLLANLNLIRQLGDSFLQIL